jgi:hypothetical protein
MACTNSHAMHDFLPGLKSCLFGWCQNLAPNFDNGHGFQQPDGDGSWRVPVFGLEGKEQAIFHPLDCFHC